MEIPGCQCPATDCSSSPFTTGCEVLSAISLQTDNNSNNVCDTFSSDPFQSQYGPSAPLINEGLGRGIYYPSAPIAIQFGTGTCQTAQQEMNSCPTSPLTQGRIQTQFVSGRQCGMMTITPPPSDPTKLVTFRISAVCSSWYNGQEIDSGYDDSLLVYVQQKRGELTNLCETQVIQDGINGVPFEPRLSSQDWIHVSDQERYMCFDGGFHTKLGKNWYIMITSFGNEPCHGPNPYTDAPTVVQSSSPSRMESHAPSVLSPSPSLMETKSPTVSPAIVSSNAPSSSSPTVAPVSFVDHPKPTTSPSETLTSSPSLTSTLSTTALPTSNIKEEGSTTTIFIDPKANPILAFGVSAFLIFIVAAIGFVVYKKKSKKRKETTRLAKYDELQQDVCVIYDQAISDGIEIEPSPRKMTRGKMVEYGEI
ncbi:predicted protein [Chaetoceros tenuissimus]|uniref:Uncharacterized protein n=1 Tax=Chaetoceros tenuissimus TaxID=426638 RepID=A0AAD3D001_9STRA|nr:predicted protein [Chaetoceros tenuissimus]